MNDMITVKHLSKSYAEKEVVHDINIHVKQGEVYGLLGENGAGKSTTIECILGTKKADQGEISILNLNPIQDRKKLFEMVSVQFQETNYQDKITVKELCQVTESLYQQTMSYQELLKQFHLDGKEKLEISELSGGEKQKLFIVLALIPHPQVVFLDELTTGLDTKARRDVWNILLDLKKKGLTIFLTSHFMDEVEILCDRIAILKDHHFIYEGSVQDAIAQSPYDDLEEAYLWWTKEEENSENI